MTVNTFGQDTTTAGGSIIPTAPTQAAATAPITPTPQVNTPATPQTAGYNANATAQIPTLVPQTTAQPQQTAPTTQTDATQPATAQQQLAMPATGSVVDLLNSAGQDSSYAARQQLAQQYGIQNYAGTAAQNQELSQKYLEAYNKLKGSSTPQTASDARSALQTYQDENKVQAQQNPIQQFMDTYGSMNPIEANLFQQLSTLTSSIGNQQSLSDLFQQESAAQGLPDLNLQLADLNKIMDGTEDDIRTEIQNVGGMGTESQVQALAAARNKTILKQANYLQNVINSKNDYVDRIVSLTQADRDQVSKDLDQKLGITNTLISMTQHMEDNARQNYQTVVNSVGWEGLAKSVAGNPQQTANVEQIMGLQPGELASLATYKKPLTEMEQAQLTNQQLQNKKLSQDLNTAPSVSTQVVDLNGRKVLINSKTGAVISDIGAGLAPTPQNAQSLALQQQTIQDTSGLLSSPGLAGSVGPNPLARSAPDFNSFTGVRSNFIAGVQQLTQKLTLDQLVNAKAQGATFGALSEGELGLLSASASKINNWAIKDNAGNVVGYNISEKDFKAEVDKINSFQKLDFVLKGGDPESVGVQQMPDGTLWTKNSDGSLSRIQ